MCDMSNHYLYVFSQWNWFPSLLLSALCTQSLRSWMLYMLKLSKFYQKPAGTLPTNWAITCRYLYPQVTQVMHYLQVWICRYWVPRVAIPGRSRSRISILEYLQVWSGWPVGRSVFSFTASPAILFVVLGDFRMLWIVLLWKSLIWNMFQRFIRTLIWECFTLVTKVCRACLKRYVIT